MGNEILKEIKYSPYQALFSIITPIALYEPFNLLVKQSLMPWHYWGFIFVYIVARWVYRNFIRVTAMMLSGTPAIIITRRGITLTQLGFIIEWKDISDMNLNITSGKGRSYNLVINVKEPWKYICKKRNPITRYSCWYLKDYINPFEISLAIIDGNSVNVYNEIENCFYQYKHAKLAH